MVMDVGLPQKCIKFVDILVYHAEVVSLFTGGLFNIRHSFSWAREI